MHLASMKGPEQLDLPLRVGPVVAGPAEIRALWWGDEDPRQFVMGSRGGNPPTFSRRQKEPPPTPPPPPTPTPTPTRMS